ncbi:Glycosyltransferase involved in cell wall bisynthesis [Micromonospora rhizosphaerae]|uniref:Glycosyltransferase involved in cell wall bisynthesis n=1 Tax=Micromonospora rhizosphaerae TaxID=568872 RepID=A0A1C6TAN5_9ACTN|nr:glycosyltransferase [Micromonospora rhizosphaerae]SCL38622.1 Glycosyltransferase involved in cell wall bisynthesis [Micromonospora rhizosphaerae]
MKVLHVITGLWVGGAELQLELLLRHTRHEPEVVTLDNRGQVADNIAQGGVQVRDLTMTRNTEVSALGRLRRIIREGRYDVVHTHLYRAQIYGHLAARLAGTRAIVTTQHSIGETHIERRRMSMPVRALYLTAEHCSHATIAVSDVVRDRLVAWGVPSRKITVVPKAVDFAAVAFDPVGRVKVRMDWGIGPNVQVIGVLGRLDPNKRVDLVIRAAAPLLGERRRLVVVGDGEDRERLEQTAREVGVTDHVLFAGARRDVGEVLSSFDILVAAPKQETFGLAMLEALGNGLPLLYTTCPALDGIETDRARQVPGDEVGLRRELAAELRAPLHPRMPVPALCERYGIESVAARIDDLYERIAARGPALERVTETDEERHGDLSPSP